MSAWREWIVRESSPEATAARLERYRQMLSPAEWREFEDRIAYSTTTQPFLVLLFVGQTEDALRAWARGEGPLPTGHVQRLIVQGSEEARRIQNEMIGAKQRRGLARQYGGSTSIALPFTSAQQWGI